MILKIVLGKGGRGLLSYLSQPQKAATHCPQNDPKIYGRLHIPDSDFHTARGGQPAAAINQLPNLSFLNVVHNPRPNAANHRIGKGSGEVFLPGDALHHVERGPAVDADSLRRPGHRPGSTSIEKSGGKRRIEKASAPPTFSTFAGRTPREIAAEFGALRKLKPNLGKAVAHLILSPGPEDRVLSKDEWKRALDLALAEHGAADAPHAAYLHADTDHPHLHVFYSRITPAGQVISDSLSYQKNRSASLKITQELKLTPLPNTTNPQALGDRQALDNASHRAERNGTTDPTKIDVKAIRAALAEALDRDHFLQLLAELGIEAEFDRRGVAREIYGWRLRRIGAAEWLKASTLAKDLSYPKIAHRFTETESMAPVTQTPAAAVEAEAEADTDRYARAPAPIRQLLREQHQQRQLMPAPTPNIDAQSTKKTWDIDLEEVRRATEDFGVLTKAMARIGAICLKYSLSFLKLLVGWIKQLLAKFGIGVRELQQVSGPQVVRYEPYTLDVDAREVSNADAVAQLVDQVTAALEDKDIARLPDVEGRDTIAAAMLTDQGREPEETALDAMFSAEAADASAPAPVSPEAPPATPPKTALVQFLDAAKAYSLSAELVRVATLKDIDYFDRRPLAQKRHDEAAAELYEVEKALAGWRASHKVAATLGADPQGLRPKVEAARARAAEATAALRKADREHCEFEIVFDKMPTPTLSFATQDRHTAAAAALKKAQEMLFYKARLNLTVLDPNPMLRSKREQFGSQIRRAETRLAAFLIDPRTQPSMVKDVDEMIRALASEVATEKLRLAPRPDADDGQNVDEAGQHGFAVPGQR